VREIEVVRGEEDGAPGRRPFADELEHVMLAELRVVHEGGHDADLMLGALRSASFGRATPASAACRRGTAPEEDP
jgi:hypothetical protein